MKSECLPFSQIPHTTRLFADFIAYDPGVRPFYPRSPHFSEWLAQEQPNARYDSGRRQRVSNLLDRQNRQWNASSRTLANIDRLRRGACVAVTGQQVGLFGGPLFSVFKALTAVRLADQATAAGVECVPVFWLATEDHDLAEVNHATLLNAEGALQRLAVSSQGAPDAPVATIHLGSEVDSVVAAAADLLGTSDVTELLRESYQSKETLGSAFARLFARLFADWGVILLDASDPELHAVGEPIYRAAIEQAVELDDALLARGKELEAAGYHQQVKVTPSSTLLFTFRDGARVPVHRRINGSNEVEFLVADEKISRTALLDQIAQAPEEFSANVLLRPVLEDFLLPTLAYTGGSAEVAYFAQAAVVYQALLGHVTPIIPRFSATLVDAKPQRLLDRYGVKPPDLFHGPEKMRERLAERVLPADLQAAFEEAKSQVENSFARIRDALGRLDTTLVDAAERAGSKIQYQLEHLRSSAARAELRQSELLARHAEVLSNSLYPDKALQEREIAGAYFLARHGLDLLRQLYDAIQTDCLDHQLVYLQ